MRISDWSSDVCSSDLPIVRSLLDDDFYKLLMGQLIFEKHPKVQVAFGLNNRTKDVRLADIIAVEELREQLDHVRTLRFQKDELIWLRGQTFYGVQGIFSPGFIHELEQIGRASCRERVWQYV